MRLAAGARGTVAHSGSTRMLVSPDGTRRGFAAARQHGIVRCSRRRGLRASATLDGVTDVIASHGEMTDALYEARHWPGHTT